MLKTVVATMVLVTAAFAQSQGGLSNVRPHYTVGETIRYTVTFEGDPNFASIMLYFQAGPIRPDQAGLANNFSINRIRKDGPGQYVVEGQIPESTGSGTYQLFDVQPRIQPSGVKDYDAKAFNIVFDVDNPVKYLFPPLKNVTPK